MKLYVKANSHDGYLYIFKHGLGPGTIPKDVAIVKEKDLPNGYTAVWLDRFLTTSELKAYDIPPETDINYYLDRIGYCQKDGDVVPCDEVTASTKIPEDADLPTFKEFATSEWDVLNDGSKRLKLKDLFVYYGTDKQWNASDPGYWYEIRISDKTYKESKKYSVKNRENCYKAMQNAVKELLDSNAEASDDVEACEKVTASAKITKKLKKEIFEELAAVGGYFNYDRAVDELMSDYSLSKEDADSIVWEFTTRNNVECCGDVEASEDTKYFANMVSCSTDELDDEFLVEGYYDNQYRGLAESAETSDVSALNELINEYANRGYFIRVHNLTDGIITEFSPDNWFDDLAKDGGAMLFMS